MNEPVQGTPPGGLNLADIYYVLFRRKWIILFFCLLAAVSGVVVCIVKPPRYHSDAELFIRYVVDGNLLTGSKDDAVTRPLNVQEAGILDTEKQIIQSLDVAEQVVDAVGAEKILAKIDGGTNHDKAAATVLGFLKVQLPLSGSVISISYEHPDPVVAQEVLRQVIIAYINKHKEIHRPAEIFGDFLPQETKRLQDQLDQTEHSLKDAKNKAGVISLDEAKKAYAEQRQRIREDLFDAQASLAEHQAALGEVTNLLSAAPRMTNSEPQVPIDLLAEYKNICARLDLFSKREQDLLVQFTPDSSPVKDVREQIADVKRIKKRMENDHPNLLTLLTPASNFQGQTAGISLDPATEAVQVRALKSKIEVLNRQLELVEDEQKKVVDMEDTIQGLDRKRMLLEAQLRNFSGSLETSRIEEALGAGRAPNIGVVQSPTPPAKGWSKQFKKKLTMLLGGCVACGFGLAFLLEMFLDRSVRRPVDVTGKLKSPLFITIPDINRNGGGYSASSPAGNGKALMRPISAWEQGHPLRRFYEGLRDRLIVYFEVKKVDHKPKLVGVTSCSKRAGVSSIAAGLASSLSETGDGNVLLVDLKGPDGTAQQFYKGTPGCGLEDALESETRKSAQVQSNLYVVTEHPEEDNSGILFPKRFSKLMPKLKSSTFDYIIFDMPPVSQTSITPRLGRLMDMVLFVVESEKTSQDVAKQALALLAESKTNVSIVLNKTHTYVPPRLHQELLNDI